MAKGKMRESGRGKRNDGAKIERRLAIIAGEGKQKQKLTSLASLSLFSPPNPNNLNHNH